MDMSRSGHFAARSSNPGIVDVTFGARGVSLKE
jgi:hypothetical protein